MAEPQQSGGFTLDDVAGNADFHSLSLQDKNAFLMQHVPEFAKGAPKDRADLVNVIHYGEAPKPTEDTSSILGGAAEEVKDIGKSWLNTVKDPRNLIPVYGPLRMAYKSAIEPQLGTIKTAAGDIAKRPMSLINPTPQEMLHQGEAALPFAGPMAARLQGIAESGAGREAIGRGAVDIGAILAGEKAGRMLGATTTPAERAATGTGKLETALSPRVGRGGEAATQMRADLEVAQPHLSKIARETPISGPSILQRLGGKGDPGWFNEAAGNIADYKQNLWQEAHEKPVSRQANKPFNYTDDVRQRALSEIGSQDDALQSAKAREWVDREIPRIETVGDADARIRRLNAEVKSLPEEYGPVGVRVRFEALKAIRDALDTRLEEEGERGVRQSNREWGALRNIEDRLRERYFQETGKAAKASPIPDWAHLYMFGHPGGVALGAGLRVGNMLKPSPAMALGTGFEQLGRAGLEPRPLPTAPPAYTRPIAGLLGAGPLTTPAPADTSFVRGVPAMTEAPAAVRFGRLLGTGEGVGPLRMPPSPLSPVAGSEPTPTGGMRGFPAEPQPALRFGGEVTGEPAPVESGTRAERRGLLLGRGQPVLGRVPPEEGIRVEEPETIVVRDPRTGRMVRQYLGTSKKP